jgi:hypothetical protein
MIALQSYLAKLFIFRGLYGVADRQLDEKLKKRPARAAKAVARSKTRCGRSARAAEQADDETHPGRLCGSTDIRANRSPAAAGRRKKVLLIIGGGIAAYKSLDLIRRLKERKIAVRCIMTKAAEYQTLLSASALVGERVFTDLFDPASEFDVGHIRRTRNRFDRCRPPPTMAKLAGGRRRSGYRRAAGNIGKILLAPAMNPRMWETWRTTIWRN